MTPITMELIERITNRLATDKNVRPTEVKLSEESKKLDRMYIAKERTKKLLQEIDKDCKVNIFIFRISIKIIRL